MVFLPFPTILELDLLVKIKKTLNLMGFVRTYKKKKTTTRAKPRHVKTVRRAPGIEHKFYDNWATAKVVGDSILLEDGVIPLNNTPEIISAPPVGNTSRSRDGKRIVIDTIMIEGNVSVPWSDVAVSVVPEDLPRVYVALVLDSQANGSQANLSEVMFTNPSAHSSTIPNPLKNLHSGVRFTTLKVWNLNFSDLTIVYDGFTGNVEWSSEAKDFSCYLKVNIPVNFNGVEDASVAAVNDNALYIVAFTDHSTAPLVPIISFNSRIRYVG